MNKLILSTLFISLFYTTSTNALGNIERGSKLVKQTCALCHGNQGEKSALNQSKIIKSLPTDELQQALILRKNGKIIGAGNKAKARLSEQDINDIATFLSSIK